MRRHFIDDDDDDADDDDDDDDSVIVLSSCTEIDGVQINTVSVVKNVCKKCTVSSASANNFVA